MNNAKRLLLVLSAGCAAPVAAHHSYAMFDATKNIALTGTVKDWKWTNPHTFMLLAVPGPGGRAVDWSLEGQSPQVLRRKGWEREMVKVGDKVTMNINPLKAGSNGGQFIAITTADGVQHH